MKIRSYSLNSVYLDRQLTFNVVGDRGLPILVFPTQNGQCDDYINFKMPESIAEWIDRGLVELYCVGSVDRESWSAQGDVSRRAEIQELWFNHVVQEFYPRMMAINTKDNDGPMKRLPLVMGNSMGATHALNTFLRRPDLFSGVIALSGAYDARYFFGDRINANLYMNSIVDYMANLPTDHPYIDLFNQKEIIVCTGQGAWEDEMRRTTDIVRRIFNEKGIHAWIDFWGYDVNHDWPWWRKQLPYFLNHILPLHQ